MTELDPLDVFNLVETAAKNTILNDPWLGDSDNVKTVHEKINRNEEDDPTYLESEMPAIGIFCAGSGPDSNVSLGSSEQTLRVEFDVVVSSGDKHEADARCKQIMARLRRLMRVQMDTATYEEATELDGFATGGDVLVNNETSFTTIENDSGWWAEGATAITVVFYSQE